LSQNLNVEILNMTSVASQVDRDSVGAGLFTSHRSGNDAWFRCSSRLANRGYMIDIDVETG
jgi:hypothetical protein